MLSPCLRLTCSNCGCHTLSPEVWEGCPQSELSTSHCPHSNMVDNSENCHSKQDEWKTQELLVYSDPHVLWAVKQVPCIGSPAVPGFLEETSVHDPPWPHMKWILGSVSLLRAAQVCCLSLVVHIRTSWLLCGLNNHQYLQTRLALALEILFSQKLKGVFASRYFQV